MKIECVVLLAIVSATYGKALTPQATVSCDVVIVGGATAAVAAAISSAQNGVSTCLLEPTDWPGGQITSGGVSEMDFAWKVLVDKKANKTLNVPVIDRDPINVTPSFQKLLSAIGNPGFCVVSPYCFPPAEFLDGGLFPLLKSLPNLQVFYNTVIKDVVMSRDGTVVQSIVAITRTPVDGLSCGGWDIFLSHDVLDWYSAEDSDRYTKTITAFIAPVFMDASEWGELLALSGAPYLQGLSERYDGDVSGIGDDTCGQAVTLSFTQVYNKEPTNQTDIDPYPDPPEYTNWFNQSFEYFNHWYGLNWNLVWESRRIWSGPQKWGGAAVGDISLLNYYCSDNIFSYTLVSRDEASQQAETDWLGGVDVDSLQTSEWMAMAWHYWYKNKSDPSIREFLSLGRGPLGTCHGLSKYPYMRDTRRSIGIDMFLLNISGLIGPIEQTVAEVFPDRVAIGVYDVDIHFMHNDNCTYPNYTNPEWYTVLPYYVPFRAMTHYQVSNMLVAGKTMAQSFTANAATRLHPVEWSTGTAAGVAAAFMVQRQVYNTAAVYGQYMSSLQQMTAKYTPNRWYINGAYWPPSVTTE